MNIHIKNETSSIRVFLDNDKNYYDKDAYDTIMTVHHIGDDEIYICGLHGVITRKILMAIYDELKLKGIKTVRFERNGKEQVYSLC